MRAAVQDRYGPPEVVRIADVDRPSVGDGYVLVKVAATSVNRTDCACRAARPFFMRLFTGLRRPRGVGLGTEFAGTVEQVGRRVSAFSVGSRVFGYSDGSYGAHAEYLAVPEHGSIATIPVGVTFSQAAVSTEGAHYALAQIRGARIVAGQDVLVNGATGAIGSAAVQLLKTLGVTVTAVCDSSGLELVRGLGADRVVDYTTEDFTRSDRTYDVVLDTVGKSSFTACRPLLRPAGVYISSELGRLAENPLRALVSPLQRGQRVKFPVPRHDQGLVGHLRELLETGAFRPVVDRSYALDEIVEAYRYVETGRKTGNVVILVDPFE